MKLPQFFEGAQWSYAKQNAERNEDSKKAIPVSKMFLLMQSSSHKIIIASMWSDFSFVVDSMTVQEKLHLD